MLCRPRLTRISGQLAASNHVILPTEIAAGIVLDVAAPRADDATSRPVSATLTDEISATLRDEPAARIVSRINRWPISLDRRALLLLRLFAIRMVGTLRVVIPHRASPDYLVDVSTTASCICRFGNRKGNQPRRDGGGAEKESALHIHLLLAAGDHGSQEHAKRASG